MTNEDPRASQSNRREFVRWPFAKTIRIVVEQPGGAGGFRNEFTAPCANLSHQGAAFLHRHYVHVGCGVSLILPRVTGGEERVAGVVMRCQHVSGVRHEVGVQFTKEISLAKFIAVKIVSVPETNRPAAAA